MFYYSAFRLFIQSPFPLSNFSLEQNLDREPDVVIESAISDQFLPSEIVNSKVSKIIDPNNVLLVRPAIEFCLVREGREVILRPAPDADMDEVALFIQTTVMQLLLYQRGYFLLHGSAVDINGGAIVFIARSTGGKSTLAAFMNTLGFSVIADDLVAIRIDDDGMVIIPSKPHLRLWPDAATYVGKDVEQLPRVLPTMEKRILQIDHDANDTDVPLRRIYVLDFGTALEIQPLNFQDSFQHLFKNMTFAIFYANELERFRDKSLKLMSDCAKVARTISVARLQRPRSLELLPQIAGMIVRDMEKTP